LPERFVLFVGTIEPRKNLGGLLHAFQYLRQK
jgi:glycosyltransferase involved in cell wall biosynthesis